MTMANILLECCCGSAEDALEAARGGAGRAELCSDLFHGGLTPSIGSLKIAKAGCEIPIMAMIRPREGGFCYTETEFAVCIEDAKALIAAGADGLVFGFLHQDGTLDAGRTQTIAEIALSAGKEAVFHRAIDVVPDWREAMDTLMAMGLTRVLTSGQESDVSLGTETVRQMIEYAAGRIQVMPGAGITARNMQRIIRETGCCQIHLAAQRLCCDNSVDNNRAIYYGGCLYPPENLFKLTDREAIRGMTDALKKMGTE